jgi:hypothetical protein
MPTFDDFWLVWPPEHRVGKKQAQDQWAKLLAHEQEAAVEDVAWRVGHCRRWQCRAEDGRWAIPHPFRYLRDHRFEDARGRDVAGPTPAASAIMPAYDPDWCQHEPRCNSRDWHAVKVEREQR